ncbi:MAG: hypothetical protein JW821_08310 [Deltaproteobacteria bacterium]|nr:hypothetical protein [Deltaproteobacteria bacterium]
MEFDRQELQKACFEVARKTLWEMAPVDADRIREHGRNLEDIAARFAKGFENSPRDPNMVTRAVWYLARTQAGPGLREDTRWFEHMLQVLLELAFPNTHLDESSVPFLRDIEEGLSRFAANSPLPPGKVPPPEP